jgi:N-alpha-acetyl-L-2,4-diaminobutyrate deacetylase
MARRKLRQSLETPVTAEGLRVRVPVLRVRGRRDGPRLAVTAAQHGRELNGTAACAAVFEALDPAALCGEAVFLPVMNPVGVRTRRQDFPREEGRYRQQRFAEDCNLNRAWGRSPAEDPPGYARAIAETVWERELRTADCVVDLHGWSDSSLGLAWGHRRHRAAVRAFGLPWHLVHRRRTPRRTGMLEALCQAEGITAVTVELTPQNRLCRTSVRRARRGIRNLLRHAGQLEGKPELPPRQYEFDTDHVETVVKAPTAGLVESPVRPGEWIRAGEEFLALRRLTDLRKVWSFAAPRDALVWNAGRACWGEDYPEHAVVEAGQTIGLLKEPSRILRHADAAEVSHAAQD